MSLSRVEQIIFELERKYPRLSDELTHLLKVSYGIIDDADKCKLDHLLIDIFVLGNSLAPLKRRLSSNDFFKLHDTLRWEFVGELVDRVRECARKI